MLSASGRNRLAAAAALLLLAGAALTFGQVTGTFALFSAETENQGATAAGGWIPAPSGLSSAVGGASNDQAQLAWTSGASAASPSPNPVTGQQLQIADGGSGASAGCGGYSNQSAALPAGATSTTDGGAGVPFTDWWCYRMVSTSGGSWTSSADFTPVRLLVPVSVVFAGNGDGKLESGETITITFNQDVASSSVAVNGGICQVKGTSANGYLVIGYGGSCSSSASYGIGKISGITVGKGGSTSASVSVSGSVVTVTATTNGQNIGSGGTFVAATTVTASAGSPAACVDAACSPAPSGTF